MERPPAAEWDDVHLWPHYGTRNKLANAASGDPATCADADADVDLA